MPSYTLLVFSPRGGDPVSMKLEAKDDAEAIAFLVEAHVGGLAPIELRQGERLVRRFEVNDLPNRPEEDD